MRNYLIAGVMLAGGAALLSMLGLLLKTAAWGQGWPPPYPPPYGPQSPPPYQAPPPPPPMSDPYREFHSWGGYDRGAAGMPDPRPQRRCLVPYGSSGMRAVPC